MSHKRHGTCLSVLGYLGLRALGMYGWNYGPLVRALNWGVLVLEALKAKLRAHSEVWAHYQEHMVGTEP